MKKKIAIIILTITVFATSIVSSVFAAVKDNEPVSNTQTVNPIGGETGIIKTDITSDGWKYDVYDDNTVGIRGYEGTETTATLPEDIDGRKITCIREFAFSESIIEKLIIPDAKTFTKEIYESNCLNRCFASMHNLKEVVIGSMFARELPYCMFHSCKKLERVTFTEKFTEVASTIYTPADEFNIERTGCYINKGVFGYCPELHNIVIPEGVTRVNIEAFMGSKNIDTIVAPTSLVSVNKSNGAPDDETRCPAPFGVKRLIILGTKTKTNDYENIEIIGPKNSYIEEQQINTGEFELIDIATIDVQKIIDEINGVEPVTETTTSTATSTTTNTTTSTSTSTATSTTTSTPASTKPSTTTTTVPASTRPSTTKVPTTKVPTTTAPVKTNTPTTKYAGSFSTTLYVARSINNYHMNGEGIRYKSKNPKIATVDKNGKITAKSEGKATIVITNNTTKTYTHIIVTVKKPTINKTQLTLKKNKKFKLKITGQVGTAKFSTNNKNVVKVNKRGIITAKKKGKATITIKTNGLTLKCKVTVK